MKLVEQSVQLLPLRSINEQIELAARTCYKSEDKITEDSSEKFVQRLIDNNHTAMLEHGTVYLKVPHNPGNLEDILLHTRYANNPYSHINIIAENNNYVLYITTNYRVIIENEWEDDLQFQCEPTENHLKRYSVKITTNLGIARELCRHRKFSFAQESTRYCNYDKDKFGNELTFIIPYWIKLNSGPYKFLSNPDESISIEGDGYLVDCKELTIENSFIFSCVRAEFDYTSLIRNYNLQPQQARDVLPLSLKTEIVMTGFENDWKHFFELRLDESTGKVHPDMKELAQLIHIALYGDSNK